MADATGKKQKLSKAEKKELKKARKAEIKQKKKDGTYNPEDYEDEGGLGLAVFAIFFIILVWLAIFGILIRMDVGGLGSTIMYPIIKDIPVINKVLPDVEYIPEDNAYTFRTLDEAIIRVGELEKALAESQAMDTNAEARIAELEALVAALQPYKDNVDAFNKDKQIFYEEVVFSDKSPDINQYKKYYESINPTNAEIIYREVIEQQQEEKDIQDYAAAYSSMDPAEAAGIFDTMTKNFKLVARILKAMNAEQRGAILQEMDTANAAALTEMMEPK